MREMRLRKKEKREESVKVRKERWRKKVWNREEKISCQKKRERKKKEINGNKNRKAEN